MNRSSRAHWIPALLTLGVLFVASDAFARSRPPSRYRRPPSSSHYRSYRPSRYPHISRYVRYIPTYVYRRPRPVVARRYYTPSSYPYPYTYSYPSTYTYSYPGSYTYSYPSSYTYSYPVYSSPPPVTVVRRYYPRSYYSRYYTPSTIRFGIGRSRGLGWGVGFTFSLGR